MRTTEGMLFVALWVELIVAKRLGKACLISIWEHLVLAKRQNGPVIDIALVSVYANELVYKIIDHFIIMVSSN